MKDLSFGHRSLLLAALGALAGCGGSQMPSAAPAAPGGHESGLTQLSAQRMAALTMPHYAPRPVRPDRGRPWMLSQEKAGESALIYVGDWYTNDVYVYDYANGKLVGTLTGFDEPQGMCVDAKGDVYITNFDNGNTIEYARGGTSPLNTYATDGYAIGCSVDKHGDLAVTDFYSSTGPGQVAIWKGGKGSATDYSDQNACYYMWTFGYDDKGNLIGESNSNTVCALMTGSKTMTTLSTSGITIDFPGGTMWDGKYVALGDQEAGGRYITGVWPATLSGTTLSASKEATFPDSCIGQYSDDVNPFIVGKKNTPVNDREGKVMVGPNGSCSASGIGLWRYPKGGDPFKYYNTETETYGVAVSVAP